MTSLPPSSAVPNEDVRLPDGPIVRIRASRPDDEPAVKSLLASPESTRIGALGVWEANEHGMLVADFPWGGRLIGHAAWGRLTGPRAAVSLTVSHSFARWPLAAHLLVRLARLADAALIPELVIARDSWSDDFERLLTTGFGGRREPDGAVAIPTREWQAALASLEHHSRPYLDEPDEPQPSMAAARPSRSTAQRVVIAGGGVAALECVMALRDLAGRELPIQLVAPDDSFVFRPLQVVEPFSIAAPHRYPLSRIAEDFSVELVTDSVVEVKGDERRAVCASGAALDYESLILAPGACHQRAFEHAITFGEDPEHRAMRELLVELEHGSVRRVAFLVPAGTAWSLPAYELALMTARHVLAERIDDAQLWLITPERRPLAIFGPQVSASIGRLLAAGGVEFVGDAYATVGTGSIRLEPGGRRLEIDRAVALPRLRGPAIAGVPADEDGFIATDAFGAVRGLSDVYAAGDATTFPVKQGGLAAQQADAVAQFVAARLGGRPSPRAFKPVLRGLLFTGDGGRFLRAAIAGGEGDAASSGTALWWPPSKVAGLYLAPYLHAQTGFTETAPPAGFSPVSLTLEHSA